MIQLGQKFLCMLLSLLSPTYSIKKCHTNIKSLFMNFQRQVILLYLSPTFVNF